MSRVSFVFLFFVFFSFGLQADIFSAKGAWKDQTDKTIFLRQFRNKWVVASIAYTSCPTVCALTVENMKEIEKKISDNKSQPEFLLISIDPLNDNASAKLAFLKRKKVSLKKWHFISGSAEQTRQLVKKLGMNFGNKPAAKGSHLMHTFKTVLISPESEIVETVDNLTPQAIVDKYTSLQNK